MPGLHSKEAHQLTKKNEKKLLDFFQDSMISVMNHRRIEGEKLEKELKKYLKTS